MAYGISIHDSSGAVHIDTTSRVVTLLGVKTFNMSSAVYSGSFTDSNLSKGTPVYMIVELPWGPTYGEGLRTSITFSGTTCNWAVEESDFGGWDGTLVFHYGYY